jgi:CBS domain-containing protein
MRIKDRPEFMNKPPTFALHGSDFVSAAVKTMAERNIGSVVVVDDERRVLGIVTERDLLRRLLGGGLDQNATPLSSIMTSDPRTARPDDRVIDCLRLMSNERFRHLPVLDDDGRLITVLSQGDFVSFTWPEMLSLFRDKATETLSGPAAPLPILLAGLALYSVVLITVLKFF